MIKFKDMRYSGLSSWWYFDHYNACSVEPLWKINAEHHCWLPLCSPISHTIWCQLSLLNQQFDCALRVSVSLVLQADQDLLSLCVKTDDVTRQQGQSGSSSPWAPDRPVESHDGWALSISWLHLWPVPDSSWRLLYSLLGSAQRAPLTPHSPSGLLEWSHHSTKGKKHSWSWEGGREKMRCRGGSFLSHWSFILPPVLLWHCQKMKAWPVTVELVSLPFR